MKINELLAEDGRIVKGVNTTVDVSPGETKRQAAKFGNSVSDEGIPPLLIKDVDKNPNSAFNLGLTEALDAYTMVPKEIARKHSVPLKQILQQLNKGIQVELEHTSDKSTAREIALDHLAELPDYYTRLSDMES